MTQVASSHAPHTAPGSARVARTRTPGPGRFSSLSRTALVAGLQSLRGGHLTIRDGGTSMGFGTNDALGGLLAEVDVLDRRLWPQIATRGSLGAAEGYLRGWWESPDLVAVLRLLARNLQATASLGTGVTRLVGPLNRLAHAFRRNSKAGSRRNISEHYDLGNDFFRLFLDDTMTYSCAVFGSPEATLEQAQTAKLDRLCRALGLGPQHHLLEIGTGWGSMALHAATHYGCRVTTTTISRQQHELASQRVADAGLTDRISVLLDDYRDLSGEFDRIVSIEMIEAVGRAFLPTYFAACARLLKPDGLFALQAITMPEQRYKAYCRRPDFIQRYVFPGAHCPSIEAMLSAATGATDLRLAYLTDLAPHYATTLRLWREAFETRLDDVRAHGHEEQFLRLWRYYLAYCEAGYAEGALGLVQAVFAKPRADRVINVKPAPPHVYSPTAHTFSEAHETVAMNKAGA